MLSLLLAVPALAHVGLADPPPRYPTDGYGSNKACPCGVGPNDQYCSDAANRSDPNRSTTVTTYQAGETITVSAHEVIGHSGRWRIAFDPDGADLDDFNDNILLDIEDPPGNAGNTGSGDLWEFTVTLPDVPCTNCTLQLLQVMNGNTVDPVPDPTGQSTYYQCADIALVGDTTATDTGATGTTGTTTGSSPGTTGTTSPGDDDDDGTGGTTPTGTDPADTGAEEAKGCACTTSAPGGALGGLALFGLWPLVRRRRG
ncbi:MAG: SCE4755 family polysaccharide monooxygenase-like protein [Myxococcota bacterium]